MDNYKNTCFENLENEIWQPVPNYEGLYECSSLGRIRSFPKTARTKPNGVWTIKNVRERVMKQTLNTNGYPQIFLRKNEIAEGFRVHRIIGKVFISGETTERKFLNHINCIKTDNRVENLEWVTWQENIDHAAKNGLMRGTIYFGEENKRSKKVYQYTMNGELVRVFYGTKEAERITGISHKLIGRVCLGQRPHSMGYIWTYKIKTA